MTRKVFRTAWITGGSSGIGKAVAFALLAEGTRVILIARNTPRLENAAAEAKEAFGDEKVHLLAGDITDLSTWEGKARLMLQKHGPPDLLVNNAGITAVGALETLPPNALRQCVDANLLGHWELTRFILPSMLEAGGGTIVNVSSFAGLVGVYGYSAYSASKFALVGLSEALRMELKPKNIGVHVLCPPDTDTPQWKEELALRPVQTSRICSSAGVMPAEKVASALLQGIRKDRFLIIPGFRGKLIHLVARLFPGIIARHMDRQVSSVQHKSR